MYALALFVHVVGVLAMFMGLGTLVLSGIAIRRATRVEQVRALIGPLTAGRKIGLEQISLIDVLVISGVLLIAATGVYMAASAWSFEVGWIRTALISFLLIAPVGPLVVNPRLHAIARESVAAPDGPCAPALARRIHDPLLGTALQLMLATLLGIVFLMTNKPAPTESVVAMATAVGLGAASALPLWRWRPNRS